MKPHPKPYPLGWVWKDTQLQVSKQRNPKFTNFSKFIDEVFLDVVPLDICGIVLGSPYLYDRKAIIYHKENKYHLFKDKVEYIVKKHKLNDNISLISVRQMKMFLNISKCFILMVVKWKERDVTNAFNGCDPK